MDSHPISSKPKSVLRMYLYLITTLLTLLLPRIVFSQDVEFTMRSEVPQRAQTLPNTPLSASIRSHIKSANSKTDINAIPSYLVYRDVFLRVLFDPEIAQRFPSQDWEIIQNLPSHRDTQFVSFAIESVEKACNKINVEYRGNRSPAAIAAFYESSKREIDKNLNDHYEGVLNSLSNVGRQVILSEFARTGDSNSITNSELDLVGLSLEEPDFVVNFLNQTCANMENFAENVPTGQRLLKDEFINAYDDGVITIHR